MKVLTVGIYLHVLTARAFQPGTTFQKRQTRETQTSYISTLSVIKSGKRQLRMSQDGGYNNEDNDDDDDDDEYIADADLADWRSFRKTLVDSGISYATTEEGYLDADGEKMVETTSSSSTNTKAGGSSNERPTSVSKANEELLEKQSKTLAEEYKGGVWAHEAAFAEVGGLVVRMPLEAEIYKNKDKSIIGEELVIRLKNDEDIGKKNIDEPISQIAAQTFQWYQKAQSLIKEEMSIIANRVNEKGEIDPSGLPPKTVDLLKLYVSNQQNWQSVCLVTKMADSNSSAETYTLNRPMAFNLSENLAKMVLYGVLNNINRDGRIPPSEINKFSKFVRAFEKECAIYVGGPDNQEKPAVVIHGIPDLEGAVEISPGTGIYKGGLDAAIDGVLDGRYKPLDFRFFIGCNAYNKGELDIAILSNKYQPIACARSLALKQCIQLPKPLWHEVMEMCGGELREVSRLELKKRTDISQE